MGRLCVIYDACVLYPAPLRDALMSLAVTGVFQARWTAAIHDEWTRNLLQSRPDLTAAQVARTCLLMNRAVPNALITRYERLIETLTLPDAEDRHVLAAAIHFGAQHIITFNSKDFPQSILSGYGITTQHPDSFIVSLLEKHTAEVATVLEKQRLRLVSPPVSVEAFLDTLTRQGLPRTVERLRQSI